MDARSDLTVLSLGWGVQSWALAAMSALGKLPPIDVALHADTGWERSETLAFAERWTPWLEKRGIDVVTVSEHEQSGKMLNGEPDAPSFTTWRLEIPAYTTWPPMSPEDCIWRWEEVLARNRNGAQGMLRRQCTSRWKIQPMRRWLSTQLDSKPPGVVEQWIGITLDEAHRAKQSDVQYIVNRWPFLEMLDRPWTRGMVIHWLRGKGLEVPVSSSCIICPYHDDLTWRRIKQADNSDWQRAVEVDRSIRDKRPGYKCYLHSSRRPLEDVRLGIEQLEMW